MWLDIRTKHKMNENSKIIQVEGNIACGKHDFAQRLADQLGMKFMPDVDLERYFINDFGFDYRALNTLLPERLRFCDFEMFHENPSRHSVIHLQQFMFKLRIYQYVKATQHIFNTGQGVVLARSAFTERVFVEAMHDIGWLPRGYLRSDGVRFYDWKVRYIYMRNVVLQNLLKPHLTIYLDTPVDICMQRIKSSDNPMIANSKALVPEFLEKIERAYNDIVLPKQDVNGHSLSYEYRKRMTDDDILDVIDDIKALDFTWDVHDTRFDDWDDSRTKGFWFAHRRQCTTMGASKYFDEIHAPWYDIAGMGDSVTQADLILRESLYENHVGDLGYLHSFQTSPHVRSLLNILRGDIMSFGEKLECTVRTDCR